MCEPVTMAVLSGATSAMGTIASHQAQQQAVNRQNQIQQQEYQRQLQIAERDDLIKKRKHAADLKAHASAQTDLIKQQQMNQTEADRAKQAAARKLKEKGTEAAFEREAALAKQIQASGTILSTGNTGQSTLLAVLATERELGKEGAMIEQTLFDANAAYGNEILGVNMRQYGADSEAFNAAPPAPTSPGASFIPNKPIKAKGPSGLSLIAGLAGAGMDAAGTYKAWS
jgi:FKBP-type peptidyl-prolyl cis-trans isomerase